MPAGRGLVTLARYSVCLAETRFDKGTRGGDCPERPRDDHSPRAVDEQSDEQHREGDAEGSTAQRREAEQQPSCRSTSESDGRGSGRHRLLARRNGLTH